MKVERAHCLFEQSGTFKNEFRSMGIDAEDYDILNDFGQTDHVIDLFAEIRGGVERRTEYFRLYDGTGFNRCVLSLHTFRGSNNADVPRPAPETNPFLTDGQDKKVDGAAHGTARNVSDDNDVSGDLHRERPEANNRKSLFRSTLSPTVLVFSPVGYRQG